ncbi:MAG: 3-methyl-2-oxobutanoate dehydrogenase subunit VorB [Lachnospiraceae bacterium]|nr:3-methyl-2-oxobutanoate dehydrogenase subunit VorB [Lachnospiraceae bacterium]
MAKIIMKGNEAVAKAAIIAGCRYFFGYPITPQNEVPEYLSRELFAAGGTFVQAESEVAAINMVYGAGGSGARVMTSSSSPGIALKQEGIGYCVAGEVPCVIVSMMRGGPGLGTIQPSQSDYNQATRGGANGDYHIPVLAPGSVQEAVDDVKEAFEIADCYRTPVIVVADGLIGQMMEPVELENPVKTRNIVPKETWAMGYGTREKQNFIENLVIDSPACEAKNVRFFNEKYSEIEKNEVKYEEYMMDDAEYAFVAYGTTSRIVKNSVNELREKGYKIGLIKPRTLWPFPQVPFQNKSIRKFVVVEMSMGQMVTDVELAVGDKDKVTFYGRCGGMIPTPEECADYAEKVMGGAK